MTEKQLRAQMVAIARSLFARGYSFGTSGNLSVRCGDGVLITPTGSSFETVGAADIAKVTMEGLVSGPAKPSKEVPFHLAVYRACPDSGAVVHLHSTYAVAASCLKGIDKRNALPALTPYYVMRIGTLPVVPYLPPGDPRLGPEVERCARTARAILLQNHGPITVDRDLPAAAALAEELEEQAKLYFLLGRRGRRLTLREIAELRKRFGAR